MQALPLQQRIRELSPEERAILIAGLRAQAPADTLRSTAGAVGDSPLSCTQQSLWLADQEDLTYVIPTAVWLRGSLLPSALARALQAIVARHGVLRTSFPVVDGQPVQRVAAAGNWRLSFVDLSALDG
ncbi:MAG TPA: condensation domain-containing protein, partial [Bryobacteraceae bacterium]|nr:condensation domain-containing protein [Bryobacteraceae bacterium]